MLVIIKRSFIFLSLCLVLWPFRALAFALNPTSADDSVEPGQVISRTFQIANTDSVSHEYRADLVSVKYGANDGEMSFSQLDSDLINQIEILPKLLSLGPNQVGSITVKYLADESTRSRVVPLALRIVQTASGPQEIAVEVGMMGLWFVTIGTPQESFVITDLSMPSNFLSHLPAVWHISIANTGQSVLVPEGEIKIKNVVGGTIEMLPVNSEGKRIPPGQTRTLRVAWGEENATGSEWNQELSQFTAGVFTATIEVESKSSNLVFYVLPYRTVLTLVGLSLLAIVLMRQSRRRVR